MERNPSLGALCLPQEARENDTELRPATLNEQLNIL
jgi:hypothetical protein